MIADVDGEAVTGSPRAPSVNCRLRPIIRSMVARQFTVSLKSLNTRRLSMPVLLRHKSSR